MTGARLGPYRLMGQLGEGGMSVVHLGLDPEGRPVAVKVLRPYVVGAVEARHRLDREVRALLRVRGAHVAEVLAADVDGEPPYVVTRYVPGVPLDHAVTQRGPLPLSPLAGLGAGLADALVDIHAAGVVHRDLKPGNVLLVDGEPTVIDFGIAALADDVRLTATGLVVGTPGYLAPEVVAGQPATPAADVHAWGATLCFAATGRPPFGRGPLDAVLWRVAVGRADLDGVPAALLPLLAAALSPQPADRPVPADLRSVCLRIAAGASAGFAARTPSVPAAASRARVAKSVGDSVARVRLAGSDAAPTLAAAGWPVTPAPPAVPAAPAMPAVPSAGAPAAPTLSLTRLQETRVVAPPAAAPVWSTSGPRLPTALGPPAPAGPAAALLPPAPPAPPPAAPDAGRAAPADRQRHRTVALACLGCCAAVTAAYPAAGAAVAVGALAALRIGDAAGLAATRRRLRRGTRRGDGWRVAATLPWHAVRGLLATAWYLPVPALVAAAVGIAVAWMATDGAWAPEAWASDAWSFGAGDRPADGWALGAGAAVAVGLLLSWSGPRGAAPRRASSWLLDRLLRSRGAGALAVLVLLALVAATMTAAGLPLTG